MNSLLLASENGILALIGVIGIVILAFGGAFVVLSALAGIWKWVLLYRYQKYNNQQVAAQLTGCQVAEKMLEGLGLNDVKVEELGFWKGLFLGNSYSPKKKAIRLRKNIFNKSSLTAVAIASQKVAIAQRHHDGDKKIAVRARLMMFGYFAPFALIPLIVIGILIDYFLYAKLGWFSIAFTVVGFAYFILSFVIVILNLKIEKRACATAVEYMQKTNVLTTSEIEDAQRLYKTYLTDYWIEFLYDIVFIVWQFFKIVFSVFGSKSKRK